MKNIKFILKNMLAVFVLTYMFSSCQKRLDELRKNPNAISEIDDAALFVNASRSLFLEAQEESVHRFGGIYAHYFVPGGDLRKADLYGDGFDGFYNSMSYNIYAGLYRGGVIKNIEEVLKITSTGETKNEVRYAMADVIGVLGYARLTDEYGEIPYTEGGKGKTEGILTPKYDTQEFIYKDMIKRLSADIAVLKTLTKDNGYFKSDFIYGNDSDKWVRFANSIKLRLAMRIRNADEDLSKATVIECLKDPLMESPTHDAIMIQTEGYDVAWYRFREGTPEIKVSDKYVTMLSSTNDPRLSVFIAKDKNGGYSGQLNGLTDIEYGHSGFDERSAMGEVLTEKSSPLYLITAAETWFLRAEASLVYDNDVAAANDSYREGIKTSMNQWNVPLVDANTFLASPIADLSNPLSDEEQIGNQMWLALTPNYFEGWSHIRRTGYPVITQRTTPNLDKGVTNGYMPERFRYSTFELSANGVNTQEAINRQGPNLIDTPVWWSKRK